jgi:hypothetical protein
MKCDYLLHTASPCLPMFNFLFRRPVCQSVAFAVFPTILKELWSKEIGKMGTDQKKNVVETMQQKREHCELSSVRIFSPA